MNCKEPTQRAIDAANKIRELQDWGMHVLNDGEAATIIQAAIDEAVREAADRYCIFDCGEVGGAGACVKSCPVRAAILGEDV